MKHLDLFSGIGGFALAARRVGWQTVGFVENDEWCHRVLEKNFPGVPIHDDIKTYTGAAGSADLITAGWPCQDLSTAGQGAGLDGERSGLFFELARVIGEVRPRVVVLENVSALLVRGFDRVLGELVTLGYDCEWHCIPAAAVGAPHLRDRIWIIAYADTVGDGLRHEQGRQHGQGRKGPPESQHDGETEPLADTDGDRRPQEPRVNGSKGGERREPRNDTERCRGDVADAGGARGTSGLPRSQFWQEGETGITQYLRDEIGRQENGMVGS